MNENDNKLAENEVKFFEEEFAKLQGIEVDVNGYIGANDVLRFQRAVMTVVFKKLEISEMAFRMQRRDLLREKQLPKYG